MKEFWNTIQLILQPSGDGSAGSLEAVTGCCMRLLCSLWWIISRG